jgi:hypothetical protein
MSGRKLVFKVLGVIAGLVFAGYGIVERQSLSRMKRVGEAAVVEPITKYMEHSSRGSKTYLGEFHFKTASGREVVQKQSFPEEVLADFKAGTPVKVLYDPRDPYTFVFEKEQPSWMLVIGGVGIAIAALVLL